MKKTKNKRRGLPIILVLLLVMTATAFVGTFASYITSRDVSDSATAAKFGLNIPEAINLFSDSYTNVKADTDGKKIIAPGTSGKYEFEVNGTSEVTYEVSANISVEYSDEWDGYEPLEFSINGTEWTNFAQFSENLETALEAAVMLPNSTYENAQTIYWRWPFTVSPANDVKDTKIGEMVAAGAPAEVTVNIEVIAAQIS